MLRKFLLVGLFTLCATLYAYGPEWANVSAQSPNQSVPNTSDAEGSPTFGDGLDNISQGNFTPGEPVELNVNYTNDTDAPLEGPVFSVSLPAGVTPQDGSGWTNAGDDPNDDSATVYKFESDQDLDAGDLGTIPLPVDISADVSASDTLDIPVRVDVYRPESGDGERLAVMLDSVEVLAAPAELPADYSLSEGVTTEDPNVAFTPDTSSIAPTVDDENNVVLSVDFTPTEDIEDAQLVVAVPPETELAPNSGWSLQTIKDADGNDQTVAVLNVGSLKAGDPFSVPFPLIGQNLQPGATVTADTRLDATDTSGDPISLGGTITETLVAAPAPAAPLPTSPTNLPSTEEPAGSILYLPIINQ